MTVNSSFKEFSKIDIKILKKLSEDSRISLRQIAKDLDNKSPVTIKRHVEELENK